MKKQSILMGYGLLLIAVLTFSCESEKIRPVDPNDIPDTVSFSENITSIFSNRCSQCHFENTPPNLSPSEAYLNLSSGGYLDTETPENSDIYKIITTGKMSQYASDANAAYILKWIQQGALEN